MWDYKMFIAHDFIHMLYMFGLNKDVIMWCRRHFEDMYLLINYERKYIEAYHNASCYGESVVYFDCEQKVDQVSYKETTKHFPEDDMIALLLKERFRKVYQYGLHFTHA